MHIIWPFNFRALLAFSIFIWLLCGGGDIYCLSHGPLSQHHHSLFCGVRLAARFMHFRNDILRSYSHSFRVYPGLRIHL